MVKKEARRSELYQIKILNKFLKFLDPLGIEDLPGMEPKRAKKLRAIKINKIKKLKELSSK